MGAMASQIISLTTVYSTVYSGADQRKHQSSASLAIVRGNHRWPVNSPRKWPVTRKMFPFDDVIMLAPMLAGQDIISCNTDLVIPKYFGFSNKRVNPSMAYEASFHNLFSNHRYLECLPIRLYRRGSKKTSTFRVTGLVTRIMFPFDDVTIVCMARYYGSLPSCGITHCGIVTRYGVIELGQHCWCNGFWTYHQWGLVAITWGSSQEMLTISIL